MSEKLKTIDLKDENKPEKKSSEKFMGFFELSKEEENKLKDRIALHNGKIRIFIHPDFEEYNEKFKNKEVAFKKILESPTDKPPIFIFESSWQSPWQGYEQFSEDTKNKDDESLLRATNIDLIEKLSKRYEDVNIVDNVFFILSGGSRPDPLVPDAKTKEQAWEIFINKMKSLGVKKILLGGTELIVSNNNPFEIKDVSDIKSLSAPEGEVNLSGYVGRCIGYTIRRLHGDFKIELSSLTAPAGRSNIDELHKKLSSSGLKITGDSDFTNKNERAS